MLAGLSMCKGSVSLSVDCGVVSVGTVKERSPPDSDGVEVGVVSVGTVKERSPPDSDGVEVRAALPPITERRL